MLLALVMVPLLFAAAALLLPSDRWRRWLLPPAGAAHLAMTLHVLMHPPGAALRGWLVLDPLGRLVLLVLSSLFLICAIYTVGYLRHRSERSNRIFVACLLALVSMTTLVTCAHHLGLLWVAVEATTLSTAPLIYFNRTQRSIEATWKYLLVGSVGIAMALLGSFFLAYASLGRGGEPSLLFDHLLQRAPLLDKTWLQMAFVLFLIGYGTKMGLAPMHTWKPDAYGEAPGVVGAMLAGIVTNCAFLAVLRIYQLCTAAGESAYAGRLMIFIGLLSMIVAAIFVVGQKDIKRMLAYSSVEHMGILILGAGVGGVALFGALLHMVANGMTKGVLFLTAGNIHRACGSKSTDEVSGSIKRLPLSGTLFMFGFFAVTGSPPFGPFVSEFTILSGAFGAGYYALAATFLVLMLVVFVGMGRTVFSVVQGEPSEEARQTSYRDGVLTALPVIASFGIVLMLGIYIPAPLQQMLKDAMKFMEVRP